MELFNSPLMRVLSSQSQSFIRANAKYLVETSDYLTSRKEAQGSTLAYAGADSESRNPVPKSSLLLSVSSRTALHPRGAAPRAGPAAARRRR